MQGANLLFFRHGSFVFQPSRFQNISYISKTNSYILEVLIINVTVIDTILSEYRLFQLLRGFI